MRTGMVLDCESESEARHIAMSVFRAEVAERAVACHCRDCLGAVNVGCMQLSVVCGAWQNFFFYKNQTDSFFLRGSASEPSFSL